MNITQTMQAVRLPGIGFKNLKVEKIPVPAPSDNQLLVRVDAAGVCASNLKITAQGSDYAFINGADLKKFPAQPGDNGCMDQQSHGRIRDNGVARKARSFQPTHDAMCGSDRRSVIDFIDIPRRRQKIASS